jgi:hypothetical protein
MVDLVHPEDLARLECADSDLVLVNQHHDTNVPMLNTHLEVMNDVATHI